MSYDYFCIHCGKKLNQNGANGADAVLYDLTPIITDRVFNRIRWRVPEQRLLEMVSAGAGPDGYTTVRLSFADFMAVAGDENNLNNELVKHVTIEEIRAYLNEGIAEEKDEAEPEQDDDSIFGGFSMPSLDLDSEDAQTPEETEDSNLSEAMRALLSLETAQIGEHVAGGIREDMSILDAAFYTEPVVFDLKAVYETYDRTQRILVGYEFRRGGKVSHREDVRVCPLCGKKVFAHAGTAEHRTVAFIADSRSGKTSSILALAHYAFNALTGTLGGGLWAGTEGVPEVLELPNSLDLDPDPEKDLAHELDLFRQGIAPVKTQDKTYNPTFRVKTKRDNADYYAIITLVDIPGELCHKAGEQDKNTGAQFTMTEIDKNLLLNRYQIALSCEAYVICFDKTKINPENERAMTDIQDVCIWADEFQKLRSQQIAVTGRYVPMMVLFTKCAEIEGDTSGKRMKHKANALERTYTFLDELCEMGLQVNAFKPADPVYKAARDKFSNYGDLKTAYFSALRCSPFGYEAPSEAEVAQGKEPHTPQPRNIDQLMKWILSVSGCIPVQGCYDPQNGTKYFKLDNYCIRRKQYRPENPTNDEEALARCALFVNPGYFDKGLVVSKNNWFERKQFEAQMRNSKKYSNDMED